MKEVVSIPVIAIWGISWEDVSAVIGAGADSITVISAVVGQPDITAATLNLKNPLPWSIPI